jgi:hypothetical protein
LEYIVADHDASFFFLHQTGTVVDHFIAAARVSGRPHVNRRRELEEQKFCR